MLLALFHPGPSLATTAAAVAFGLLFGIRLGDPRLGLIAVTMLMSQLSISVMNEWADRERDLAALRPRPVAMGRVPARLALWLAIVLGLAAVPGALAFGPSSLALVIFGIGLGWTYDLIMKPTSWSFVPFAIAFPLLAVWVGIISGRPIATLLPLLLAAAPLAVAIHLADSIPDEAADAAAGTRTLAIGLGRSGAIRVMQAMLLLGSAVVVASLLGRLLLSALLALAAVLGTALAGITARKRPGQARWAVAVTALIAVVGWIVVHARE